MSSLALAPHEVLLAVNSSGRLFYLNSVQNNDDNRSSHEVYSNSKWLELPYLGIDFKRVCSCFPSADNDQNGSGSSSSGTGGRIWAIGGDHQVYIFAFGVEVPVRAKEISYENQRWNPLEGFGPKLLPTDRPNFSNGDGSVSRTKSQVKLPTLAWQWDSDWYIETHFNGKALDKEGWTYAIDFPAEYFPKKSFTSCVRRRKWIRYRRYVAVDSWSAVPPLHKDISQEPFIDISVGGHEIPNGDPNELQVWAVTVMGRVVVRQGVTSNCPEGTGWLHIPTPNKCEISQISVGASGLVWAVTWNGNALIRLGVTRIDPSGTHWCELDSPSPSSKLSHLSVGTNSVWGLSRDRRVWFRNGIRANSAGENENLAKGSKWIEMVGELHMISVGPNDQVFGITDDDHSIVFRTGVSNSDLSGKTWQALTAQPVRLRSSSGSSSISTSTTSSMPVYAEFSQKNDSTDQKRPESSTSLVIEGSSNSFFRNRGRQSTTSEGDVSLSVDVGKPLTRDTSGFDDNKEKRKALPRSSESSDASELLDNESSLEKRKALPHLSGLPEQSMYESAIDTIDKLELAREVDTVKNVAGGEEVFLPCGSDGTQKNVDTISVDSLAANTVIDLEAHYGEDHIDNFIRQSTPQWLWVSGGSCQIDPSSGPPAVWFKESWTASRQSLTGESWRVDILQSLKQNNEDMLNNEQFSGYASAIERTSWIRKGIAFFHNGNNRSRFENCTVELEQTGSPQGGIDFGTLSIFGNTKRHKEHLSLYEITCVYQSAEKTLAIQTASRAKKLEPLLIKFISDSEMEIWHADLVNGMNSVRGITGCPSSPNSVFSVTNRGEVLVFDPKYMSSEETGESNYNSSNKKGGDNKSDEDSQYTQEIEVKDLNLPIVKLLENGFGPGSLLSLTLRIPEESNRFSINLQIGQPSLDSDIALHFNPRLDLNHTVLNSKQNGEWGLEEKQPLSIFLEHDQAIKAFNKGQNVQVVIKSDVNYFEVIVNGTPYCRYRHRVKPEEVTHFRINGEVEARSVVYHSKSVIIPPNQMYWRSIGGGHFLQVETCCSGVTWALGYDSRPWVYSGGWGGAHYTSSSKFGIYPFEDTKYFYVYENQRWNPLTGYTSHGLPTDRYSWSDRTGKLAMSKETVKPPSLHWQWVSDWLIDFTTPGGVDKDGFQYATDFPNTYHGKSRFTDYVRRRRWARKCKVQMTGPWRRVGNTKLIDISLQTRKGTDLVDLWAIAANGDALFRENVRLNCPDGIKWNQVHSDCPFQSISVGQNGKVWAIGNDGSAFFRHGISPEAPTGQFWLQVHRPSNFGTDPSGGLRSISVGGLAGSSLVWALDGMNRLFIRKEVTAVFPEGTSWVHVCNDVRSISAQNNELWAVLEEATPTTLALVGGIVTALQQQQFVSVRNSRGILARRVGVTPDNPLGSGWDIAIGGGWKHVSIRGKQKHN